MKTIVREKCIEFNCTHRRTSCATSAMVESKVSLDAATCGLSIGENRFAKAQQAHDVRRYVQVPLKK